MKIISTPWKYEFLDLVAGSKHSIQITSPFVKENICQEILSVKQKNTKLELITSFKLMSIYSGSLDVSGLEKIINENGVVRNYPRLHSKIYLFDNEKAIVTSANLTNGGLVNNFEYGLLTLDKTTVTQISKDYSTLSSNENTGTIKLEHISTVRAIIEKIPPSESIKIPKIDFDSPEEQNDIIELPEEVLKSSLTGWKLEVFKCAHSLSSQKFTLDDMNKFTPFLKKIYPDNHHIPDKVRQQLQYLRDLGLIEFLGNGKYKKLWK